MTPDFPVGIQFPWYGCVQSSDHILLNNHAHPFYEVHFVLTGEVCYICEGSRVIAHAGQALLLPPNVPHRFCRQDTTFSMTYLAFQLKPDAAALMPFPKKTVVFSFSDEIINNIWEITQRAKNNDIFTPTLISSRFLEMLHTVCTSFEITLPPMPEPIEDPRLAEAKQYIRENRHNRIGCEDVAIACGLSRKQLNRIFKKHTGKTLHEYLLEIQLIYAEKLVLQGDLTIQQIGYLLGFQNGNGFGAYFKRYFGLLPKEYRAQFKNTTILME